MHLALTRKSGFQLWLIALLFGVALYFFPVSTRLTRLAGLCWLATVWLGLSALVWRWRVPRLLLIGVPLLLGTFLQMPAAAVYDTARLRQEYVRALQRYEGCRYYWGGESRRGIDCSGLIRCGLIDALAWEGLRTHDAGPIREAISLWWHDCTAATLGEAQSGLTTKVLTTGAINQLDPTLVQPGDLAVTQSGIHILAYLGDRQWIEADPALMEVVIFSAPSDLDWFSTEMNVVRWSLLQ